MGGLPRRLINRLFALRLKLISLLGRGQSDSKKQSDPESTEALVPARRPRFARFRPGLRHAQIHDPDYLLQILQVDLEGQAPAPVDQKALDGGTDETPSQETRRNSA